MSRKKETIEELERAAEQIRHSALDDAESRRIADRVWERLEGRAAEGPRAGEVGSIRGCDDFRALIPAWLAGELAPSRALLLEDHTRRCVPCRRALRAARSGQAAETAARQPAPGGGAGWGGATRRVAAAGLALVAAGVGYLVWSSAPAAPYGAIVESSGAGLYRAASLEPLAPGARLELGERVQTAPGGSSTLVLADGSRVEVRGRSELAVESARRGTTLRIERGSVIVEAAPQGRGRLFVSTDDCLVSVAGTIFAVSHGTKGSRVSVIEGEVQVDYAGGERMLSAGEQTTTYAALGHGALTDELAWSQNVDRYLELLREVTELRQALAREVPRPGLRYSSRLLDLVPDDVAFFAAFPNLAESLAEASRIVRERVAESAVLSEWWQLQRGAAGFDAQLQKTTDTLAEAGSFLGEEIVVVAGPGADGEIDGPLVLAELTDPAGLRAFLEEQMARHGDGEGRIRFLEGDLPGEARPGADTGDGLVVWLGTDTLVASPRAELVRRMALQVVRPEAAGGERPASDGLKRQLAEVYRAGAEILVAADLRRLAGSGMVSVEDWTGAERTGLLDARHLIFEQKRVGDRTHNDAVLAFDGPRRGLAALLAEPAPMGSLRYVSPDAKLAAAAVLESPVEIFDQLLALVASWADGEHDPAAELDRLEAELGFSLRDDVAAALGGEVALALDGPVLPEPAWKAIVEVYDRDKLIWALERLIEAVNDERLEAGKPPLELVAEPAGGRTYYRLAGEGGAWMTFDQGYLVAAPSRALIDRALRYRQSGYTLESSARFTRLLPADGRENFSALFYQDAVSLLEPLAERLAEGTLTAEQMAAVEALRGQTEPTLAYAYGEESRIVFAARGVADLFSSGLPGLLGLGVGLALHPELRPPRPEAGPRRDA